MIIFKNGKSLVQELDVKVPLLYVEGLRIDAYFSTRDIKRLKLLLLDYEFWSRAGPIEYSLFWKASHIYCEMKISELDPKYLQNKS